uniref:hypothetical protein RF1 n=1 Tax=Hydnora abyssinica TaxID=470280 RepID=UPI002115B1F3|nr:hypothetical protein RF1 [Hydnora abyssinica]USN93596.1 hypothetical protein RF1 [Hydnora abyssinica]
MKKNTIYNIFTHLLKKNGKYVFKNFMILITYSLSNNISFIIFSSFLYGLTSLLMIGPSYLVFLYFLTELIGNENIKNIKKAQLSALMGFFIGKFILNLSTLYTPFYKLVILNKPTGIITFLVGVFVIYFWVELLKKKKYYFQDHLDKTKLVFFINLLLPLLNLFVIPNSALKRSMNFLLFKCSNKKLFLTFEFIGSSIAYIIIFYILILAKKLVSEETKLKLRLKYPHKKFFQRFLYFIYFIIFARIPSVFTRKAYDLTLGELEYAIVNNNKIDLEEKTKKLTEMKRDCKKLNQKTLISTLVNYHGWYKPFRPVVKSFDKTENFVRKGMSEFFFNGSNKKYKFNLFYTYSSNLYYFLRLINETFSLNSNNIYDEENITLDLNFKNRINNQILSKSIESQIRFYEDIEIEIESENTKKNKEKIVQIQKVFLNFKDISFDQNKISSSFSFLFKYFKDLNLNKFLIEEQDVSRWMYNLYSELDFIDFNLTKTPGIKSRKIRKLILHKDIPQIKITSTDDLKDKTPFYKKRKKKEKTLDHDKRKDVNLEYIFVHYPQHTDFRRNLVRAAMRTKRRKVKQTVYFLHYLSSPLFFYKKNISLLKVVYEFIKTKIQRKEKIVRYLIKNPEKMNYKGAKPWNAMPLTHTLRGSFIMFHSFLRKKIVLPLLIIFKNISRLLFFQSLEFSEDFKELADEVHINCTFNGIQMAENKLPKNWMNEGMQIKIFRPFKLRPWHSSKHKYKERSSCFLTFFGKETNIPFGKTRKQSSFFKPIIKYFIKEFNKLFKFINKYILKPITTLIKEIYIKIHIIIKKLKLLIKKKSSKIKYEDDLTHEERMKNINENIRIIKKKIPKVNYNISTKFLLECKNKIKRIKAKTFILLKIMFEKKIYFVKNKLLKNTLDFNKILLKLIKFYIKKEQYKLKNEFKFYTCIKNKNISQAFIFYKLIQQNYNYHRIKFSCNTWKNLLKKEQLTFENLFKLQSSNNNFNLCKNFEYSHFVLTYLNKQTTDYFSSSKLHFSSSKLHLTKQKTLRNYLTNLNYFSNSKLHLTKQKTLINYLTNFDKIEKTIDIDNYNLNQTYLKILENQLFKSIFLNESSDENNDINKDINNNDLNKNKTKKQIKTVEEKEEDLLRKILSIPNHEDIVKEKKKKLDKKLTKKYDEEKLNRQLAVLFDCLNDFITCQLSWKDRRISKKLFMNAKFYSGLMRVEDGDLKKGKVEKDKVEKNFMEDIFYKISTFVFLIEREELDPGFFYSLNRLTTFNKVLKEVLNFSVILINEHTSYKKYELIQKLISIYFSSIYFSLESTICKPCFIPENYLSLNHCKKLRTLVNLNPNVVLSSFYNVNNSFEDNIFYLYNKLHNYNRKRNESWKFKTYIWPNFRFEDLSCINRYWFNISNGSKFNILRIKQYCNK